MTRMAKKLRRKRGLRNLNRKIQITRDSAGVPHVSASNFLDALYGLGYVHARDRLTQILFSRAVAIGRAAGMLFGIYVGLPFMRRIQKPNRPPDPSSHPPEPHERASRASPETTLGTFEGVE